MSKILLYDSSSVTAGEIANGNTNVGLVENCMKTLEKHGLGRISYESRINNRRVCIFLKIKSQTLKESRDLARIVQDLGFSLTDFIERLLLTESRESTQNNMP